MKRSFINSFLIIMILASLFASGIKVVPVEALGAMANVDLGLPSSWDTGQVAGIWGSGASDIYMVGYGQVQNTNIDLPLIYHGSGASWTSSSPNLPTAWDSGSLADVWGSGPSDVYAVGSGVTGSNTMPLVYHNGVSVTPALPAGHTLGFFNGVWGYNSPPDYHVYAVGASQTSMTTVPMVAHSTDGLNWTPIDLPGAGGSHSYLMDVWGSSSSDIYAVGYGEDVGFNTVPLIYHSTNGTNWTRATLTLPTGWSFGSLYGVWGSSATDVYTVGVGRYGSADLPLLYHSTNQGQSWTWSSAGLPSGWTSASLEKIWGANAADIYAVGVGTYGTDTVRPILYRKTTAGSWAASSPLPGTWYSGSFHSIWGATADDVYAAGSGNLNQGGSAMPLLEHAGPGADTVAPGAVTNLTATSGRLNGTVKLTWTAPADDGPNPPDPNLGPVDSYIVRYSTSAFSSCTSGQAVSSSPPMPRTPGNTQIMLVTLPGPGTQYYFVVCAQDEETNTSAAATANAVANVGNLPPEAVTLVAPTGTTSATRPTYTWNADLYSGWYYLWVNGPSGNVLKTWYTAADAGCSSGLDTCSITPSITLGNGAYTWWVQPWDVAGTGPWSAAMNFTVVPPPLGQASLISPSGTIANYNPTYVWSKVTASTWYQLSVSGPSGYTFTKWYEGTTICGASTCFIAGATPNLAIGSFTWKVQTWNSGGVGPWSATLSFSTPVPTPPGPATLTSPSGSIGTTMPTYTWNVVSDSTYYYLWVDGPSGNVIKTWYTSAQANCNSTSCSVTPSTALGGGTYTWKVQTWNAYGVGPWSATMSFTPPTLPGPATLVSPNTTIADHTPIYTWNAVADSTYYYLWVNGPSGTVIQQWYTATDAHCDASTCWVEPTTALASGAHTWWIQTWNPAGKGPWSAAMNFMVSP